MMTRWIFKLGAPVLLVVLVMVVTAQLMSGQRQGEEKAEKAPETVVEKDGAQKPDPAGMQRGPVSGSSLTAVQTAARRTGKEAEPVKKNTVGNKIKPDDSAVLVAVVSDTNRALPERKRLLKQISKRKDAEALNSLKEVAEARVYLNYHAVEAMGNFYESPQHAAAAAYTSHRMTDPESQIACAAIRAFAKLEGADAVAEIANSIDKNRVRPDGHDEIVRTAALEALRDICHPSAVPVLVAELERSEEKGWTLEYGSTVLDALRVMPTDEARKAAEEYAARLSERIPEDKMARTYFEEKIAEAREIARGQ